VAVTSSQRGSSLILSLVVVLVISVIGVAMIRFASLELAGATAGRQHQELVACAEAGRNLLLSQFKLLGTPPPLIQPLNVALDGRTQVKGGHYDDANVNVIQVTPLDIRSPGPSRPSSINWRIRSSSLGGTPYKVVVHCQVGGDGTPASGRQLEVEYGLRFGL
jgi:type II secretory pathway pseudopilin PulG